MKPVARRISAIRHVAPAGRKSGHSAIAGAAMIIAVTLAIALLSVTISAAQAIQ